jgi:hypothetical protein
MKVVSKFYWRGPPIHNFSTLQEPCRSKKSYFMKYNTI